MTVEAPTIDLKNEVVCYLDDRARRRVGAYRFLANHIDPSLCTHLVYYSEASPNKNNIAVGLENIVPDTELGNFCSTEMNQGLHLPLSEFLRQAAALRTKGVKVSLGFSEWLGSPYFRHSSLFDDSSSRKDFITKAVHFLRKNNFDGLALIWYYPECVEVINVIIL